MNTILLGVVAVLWMLVISWQAAKMSEAVSTKDRRLLIPALVALVLMIALALTLGKMLEMWLRVLLLVVSVGFGLWMGRRV